MYTLTTSKNMKNVQQNLKRRAGIIGMVCLLAVSLSSCLKNNTNDTIVQQPVALLAVLDASPDAPSLDFYLDNNKVNNVPIQYGNGLDYFKAYTGKRAATFFASGTTTKIKTDTVTFKENTFYSLFLANVASKPDYLLTVDSLKNPVAGMATIRLVNVSPDAPALDLGIKGGTLIASNRTYKTYSSFIPVSGNLSYILEVRQAGTSNVLVTIPNTKYYPGAVYTVWVHGLAAGTGTTALTADVQTNAYYY